MQKRNDLLECTFTPQITPFARKVEQDLPVELRTKAILEERERKLQKMREQLQEKQVKLSFRPEITQYNFKDTNRQPFHETVDEQILKRKEFYQTFEALKQRKEKEEATFAPSISSYSKQLERGEEPIHERLFKLSKSMSLESGKSLGQELTFQPTILNSSNKPREGSVSERLYSGALEMEARRKQVMEQLEKHEKMMMQPKVSTITKTYYKSKLDKLIGLVFQQVDNQAKGHVNYKQFGEAMKKLGLFVSGDSQVQRRTEQEVRIHEKLWKIVDPQEEGSIEFDSFKKIVLVIMDPSAIADENERNQLLTELADEIKQLHINRLAYCKTENNVKNREDAMKLRDKELTFKPKINENSIQIEQSKPYLALGRSTSQPVDELSVSQTVGQLDNSSSDIVSGSSVISSIQNKMDAWTENSMNLSMDNHNSITHTPRYEQLLQRQKEINKRKEIERMQRIQKDMKECTFQPKIIKSKTRDRRKKSDSESHFEFLYKQNKVPKKYTVVDVRSHQEKELEECTFKPMRVHTKKYDKFLEKKKSQPISNAVEKEQSHDTGSSSVDSSVDIKQTPRGYQEHITKMRKVNETEKFDYHRSLREGLKVDKKISKSKTTEFKPFNFQLDREKHKSKPLLFMDVNMGPGKTGRISIHEGDDPDILASNFAQMYKLDQVLTGRLAELIRDNMKRGSSVSPEEPTRSKTPPVPRSTISSSSSSTIPRSKSTLKAAPSTKIKQMSINGLTKKHPKTSPTSSSSIGDLDLSIVDMSLLLD